MVRSYGCKHYLTSHVPISISHSHLPIKSQFCFFLFLVCLVFCSLSALLVGEGGKRSLQCMVWEKFVGVRCAGGVYMWGRLRGFLAANLVGCGCVSVESILLCSLILFCLSFSSALSFSSTLSCRLAFLSLSTFLSCFGLLPLMFFASNEQGQEYP